MSDELNYGFIMPFFPYIPILAIFFQALLAVWLIHMSWLAWVVAPAWIGSGIIIYWLYSRKHALASHDEIIVLEEKPASVSKKYRIMVPVANPHNALQLVRNTFKVSEAKDAQVELLHMVPIPEQVPLSDADKYILPGKEAITEAMLYLNLSFPITSTIRYCRNIARGIVMAVREKKTDLIIMGWPGHNSLKRSFIFGSTIDPVVENAPCNVIILKDCVKETYKRVLVPFAGGPNGVFAFEIASILIDSKDGQIVPLNVAPVEHKTKDIESFLDAAVKIKELNRNLFAPKYIISPHPIDVIIEEANHGDYDLVIVGTTREKMWKQMVKGSFPEEIAKRCKKPFIMVKTTGGLELFIKRII